MNSANTLDNELAALAEANRAWMAWHGFGADEYCCRVAETPRWFAEAGDPPLKTMADALAEADPCVCDGGDAPMTFGEALGILAGDIKAAGGATAASIAERRAERLCLAMARESA